MDDNIENESTSSTGGGAPTNEGLMPLSMPPVARVPEAHAEQPTPAPQDMASPPYATAPVEPALMPLSMPPMSTPIAQASGDAGEGPPSWVPPYGPGWYYGPPPTPPTPRRSRKVFVVAAIVALLVGGLGAGLEAVFNNSNSSPSSALEAIPSSPAKPAIGSTPTARVYAAVEPAVVDINTNLESVPQSGTEQAAGTGMIVTRSGEVLTNNHVVDEATSITVTIQHHNGPINGRYRAKVIGVDPTNDVALLQIQGVSNLPHVSIGDSSSMRVGDAVYAIGNALGLGGQPSVEAGTVSALNRTITASDSGNSSIQETLHGLIQTNAQIQPGDSGGPLVNASGQVIGMDTAAASTDGLNTQTVGFAIPINHARTVGNQIADGHAGNGVIIGLSPFLGIELPQQSPVGNLGNGGFGFGFGAGNSGTAAPSVPGVQIEGVTTNGPAEAAGLVGGDIITAINGAKVTQATQITSVLAKYKPGDSVSISYVDTNGAAQTARAKLAGVPK